MRGRDLGELARAAILSQRSGRAVNHRRIAHVMKYQTFHRISNHESFRDMSTYEWLT